MSKQSVAGKPGRGRKKNDPQLREFERRDLGEDIRRSGAARVVRVRAKPTRPGPTQRVSRSHGLLGNMFAER